MAEWAECRRELDDTKAELVRLRALHADARHQRAELMQDRMLVAAQLARFDPSSTALQ